MEYEAPKVVSRNQNDLDTLVASGTCGSVYCEKRYEGKS